MAALPDRAQTGQQSTGSFEMVPPGQLPAAETLLTQADSENFTVAARVLPRSIRRRLLAVYGYARLVDYVGDEAIGPREGLLDLLEHDLRRVYAGTPRIPLLQALVPVVRECGIPQELLARLITANRQDQQVHRYRTFAELADYCAYSANPVGELVLHIFGCARPDLIALSDRVCTALQILEHCQDVTEDGRRGRVYLPTEDLEYFSCPEQDLVSASASPELRDLIWFEVDRARQLLDEATPLVSRLSGLARLAVAGYVAGGRATVRAFATAGHDPVSAAVRPNRIRVFGEWARLCLSGTAPGGEAVRVRSAYRRCEEITRREAKNFSYGISLLPGPKRRALSAVYAFARRIDDIGDGERPDEDKLAGLDHARDELRSADTDSADPVLVALADTARRMSVPLEVFDELIEGCEADVRGRRYETFDELLHYCRCVAGSVGRLSLAVFGDDDSPTARARADALGVALQLTNILRDVLEDRRNGRVYLPRQDMERFGVRLDLTEDGMPADDPAALAELIRFEAGRAEQWYAEGLLLLPMLDHRSRACCAAMAGIYHELLRRITDDPRTVLRTRVSLPSRQKIAVAARSLAGMAS
ncbi:farnesyl-diphosphate farnesyltransferase [Halopolyspora algeriensis]|uniref:Farnesyl-diphosphate farnesyltransferase n=1 Tax=Halopolyspora algeriensis TaxID=1500506 RepID=A0A368VWC5_9ACTN|nr:farnesyl-diphosphate farnesyltransferase [Halopolyspora algeriensis]TQM55588.1 farnesyl-diphosphate farnesyltransferase [Halopolyspora algeriensis]